jgi:membrane associated rhomboid family serine protease/L-amino acid N-acyltransferase YncA
MQIHLPDPAYANSERARAHFRLAVSIASGFVAFLWLVFLVGWALDLEPELSGIRPRETVGLIGIAFAPLVHASFGHLIANSLPLLVLGTAMLFLYPASMLRALPTLYFGTGLVVWLFGRDSVHFGASGLVYGFVGFVFVAGLLRRDRRAIAASLVVSFMYGSLAWGVLPTRIGVSWETHLAAALIGIALAIALRHLDVLPPKRYAWEDDDGEADELESRPPGCGPCAEHPGQLGHAHGAHGCNMTAPARSESMNEAQSKPVEVRRSYPRTVTLDDGNQVRLRLMVPSDIHRLIAFARSLPEDDLQFLRVDITKMLVVMTWAQNIKAGLTVTVLAEKDDEVVGYASVHHDQVSWQRHLGELRVQVGPTYRDHGLGSAMGKEIFAIAPEMGIEKIVAHMTPNQEGAMALVKRSGFRKEAVLHDFVIDRKGRKNDLIVMTCDVAAPAGTVQ